MKKVINVGEEEVVNVGEDKSGFKVIKWKVSEDGVVREFFVKAHDVSEKTRRKPVGKTLIVLNIPPFVYEENLEEMFKVFGEIVEIFIHQKPTISVPSGSKYFTQDVIHGYKVAYIVYRDVRAVKEILQVEGISEMILSGTLKCGMKKWIDDYNSQILDPSELEEDVKKYMAEFESEQIRRKEEEKQASVADDEGWVTIGSKGKGKRAGTKRTESTQEKLKAKKRRMEKAVLNITPAQIKATKVKQLEELKKKFDEDKQKIALLKQQRKFKPF